jgi:hypothetical protein
VFLDPPASAAVGGVRVALSLIVLGGMLVVGNEPGRV